MTCEDRCKLLNWDTPKKRKTYQTLVKCYKTLFNLNGMSFHEVLDYRLSLKYKNISRGAKAATMITSCIVFGNCSYDVLRCSEQLKQQRADHFSDFTNNGFYFFGLF